MTINNTSAAGVTIGIPNFRVNSVSLTNGIVHTTATNTIYCGAPDVLNTSMTNGTFGFSTNVVGSATCHIDGPIVHSNKADQSITQNKLFPVGKNGKYLPISIASTGGAELMVEAFDTNTGTTSANASNMSVNRWKVTRVGTAGAFTGYNVRLGSLNNPVTPSNLIVHAATENGVYDIVSSPTSTMTYDLAHFSLTNLPTITLTSAQTGGFLGNFSYASDVACTVAPAPGLTTASTQTPCGSQSVTLGLTTPTTGAGVTYQWQSSTNAGTTWINVSGATAATLVTVPTADTSYRCNVTCSSNTGTSTPIAVTVTPAVATTTGATICTNGVANLSAAGSASLNWYDAATGGNLVATGTTYSPTVSRTTTFYVASATTTSTTGVAGVTSWTATGSTTATALFSGIAFDVTNAVKLKTVTVYPKNTTLLTPITISLFDSTGNIVAGTAPVTFTPTLNTGTIGTVSQLVTLNYNIPVGNSYRLVVTNGLAATNNFLGNSATAITYPSGNIIRLTGNVTNLSGAVTTSAVITSCFHNLTFDEICETVRVPVTATVTAATPTVTASAATCTAAGSATVTNYDAALTYTFTPSAGITVGTGGVITGATAGTAYTVTAGNGTCTSAPSTSFITTAQLATPAIPTVTTSAATCSAAGSTTITNYNSSLIYTFTPSGPTVSSGIITGATAGTAYTVTAGNGLCTSVASASFTRAAQLATPATPSVTTVAATCAAAGSATVSNYDSSLTYVFSPSGPSVGTGGAITGATVGTAYTITAGNGSCTSAASVAFTNAAQLVTPAVPTLTTTAATCSAAGSATVSNYNASLTYAFTPSGPTVTTGGVITGATVGTAYTITAGNGSCTSAASVAFTNAAILAAPAAPTGNANQTLIGGVASDVTIEDIVVTGSNGNWYATSANALSNSNPLPVGTVLVSGTTYYTVSVSTNGCVSSTALAVTVSITLATESFEIENLKFYPNPVQHQLTISANDVITKIEVYNLLGQQVKFISNNSNEIQADLSELSSSTYIIKVYSEQKNQTIKVIKK